MRSFVQIVFANQSSELMYSLLRIRSSSIAKISCFFKNKNYKLLFFVRLNEGRNVKVCLKALDGIWTRGVALDKHKVRSIYTGDNEFGRPQFETERTEIGEALFQLKYRQAWSQVPALADALHEHAVSSFEQIDFVVPMPPSTHRARQPVTELARAVAKLTGVPCIENLLTSKAGPSLKDENDREKKLALLAGRLAVNDVLPDGKSNLLLIDDLFDTGATLEAACSILRTYSKVEEIYIATLTWT